MISRLIFSLIFTLYFGTLCLAQTEALLGKDFSVEKIEDIKNIEQIMFGKDSLQLVLSGVIVNTCQVKGCWMTLNQNGKDPIRVTFKDYNFFVPTEGMTGKQALVNGICYLKKTSVEQLKHYALDAGQPNTEIEKIKNAKIEYSFEATGVKIKN